MSRKVDPVILILFVEEAQSYLPVIRRGIAAYLLDANDAEAIKLSYRHVHTIKGASSMVGLIELSHLANEIEELLEEYATVQGDLPQSVATHACAGLDRIETMLDETARQSQSQQRESNQPLAPELLVQRLEAQLNVAQVVGQQDDFASGVDPEMLEVFRMEAEDHLRAMSAGLTVLDQNPNDKVTIQDVRRSMHTLKGAAAVVGLRAIAQLAHRMEDLLDRVYEEQMVVTHQVTALLLASVDLVEALVLGADELALRDDMNGVYEGFDHILKNTVTPASGPTQTMGAVESAGLDELNFGARLHASEVQPPAGAALELAQFAAPLRAAESAEVKKPLARAGKGHVVRVPLDRVDDLVKLVSELVISRTVLEQRMADLGREVEELQHSTDRLRRVSTKIETEYETSSLGGRMLTGAVPAFDSATLLTRIALNNMQPVKALQGHGFDELEFDRYTEFHTLSRELSETSSDTTAVGNELTNLLADFDGIMTRQRRLTSDIQERLMRLRMVPLSTLTARLDRTVRVTADQEGKLAQFVLDGDDIELDTTALSQMVDPMLHMLRNSVAHGIESPRVRRELGKPERGTIRLRAVHEGTQILIEISDDGAGLNPQKLRTTAVANGFISAAHAASMSDQEALSLIFLPGLTTAREVSEVSGRGVGMDVVKESVNKLQGVLTLESQPHKGVTFSIRLPMTLAVMRALMVRTCGETYAVPLTSVTQILRLDLAEIARLTEEQVVWIGAKLYPLVRLGAVLGLPQTGATEGQRLPVLVLKTGDSAIALVVDELLEGREIVIKSLGNHLRRVRAVMGATILGDGRVIPILNPVDLARKEGTTAVQAPRQSSAQPVAGQPPRSSARRTLNVMIVDDSPSVRRVMSNMIKAAGWQPLEAKDGLDALDVLHAQTQKPDVILLDVEMPRMDGYELLAVLKGQAQFAAIPVVMVTSRSGAKHKQKAMELGVAEYLAKPYNDETLLGIVRRLAQ